MKAILMESQEIYYWVGVVEKHEDWDEFNSFDEIYKAFWTPTEAFAFGDGYTRLGWNPGLSMEVWLVQHTLSFLKTYYFKEYEHSVGQSKTIFNYLVI